MWFNRKHSAFFKLKRDYLYNELSLNQRMYFSKKFLRLNLSAATSWPWLVALALICFLTGLSLIQFPLLRSQIRELDTQRKMLEEQLRLPVAITRTLPLYNLRGHLASFERLSIVVNDVHSFAIKNGLSLMDATYKPKEELGDAEIGCVEIDVHLKGGYLPLKRMITELLAVHDGLALVAISLQRTRAMDMTNEIELRFVFYYRKAA